jgi:hypothetical protein
MPRHRIHPLSTDPPECDCEESDIDPDEYQPEINFPDLWEPGEKL